MTGRVTINVVNATARLDLPGPVCREVYFPYVHVEATCQAPAFADAAKLRIDCLVDAVNDLAATSDRFDVATVSADPRDVVNTSMVIDQARRTARRYLFHHLGRRAKAILDFGLELQTASLVYKRFLVVQSHAGSVLIDSTTGGTHALPCAAEG